MLAGELARHFPTVTLGTDALEAARILADARLPGLIVLDDDGQPYTVLPGSQVLRFIVPGYVQEDPALARAYDEDSADAMCDELAARTVRDVLPKRVDLFDLPVVASDATSIEIAAVMAGQRSPIVAVMDGPRFVGAVVVASDATSIEIAAVMAGQRSPIVAVMDGPRFVGAVVVSALLEHLLGAEPQR